MKILNVHMHRLCDICYKSLQIFKGIIIKNSSFKPKYRCINILSGKPVKATCHIDLGVEGAEFDSWHHYILTL